MNIMDIKLAGRFTVSTIKDGEVTKSLEFPNLILNSGLNYVCQGNSLSSAYQQVSVGSGTTPPDVGQTSLVNPIGSPTGLSPSPNTEVYDPVAHTMTQTVRKRFPIGAVVGNVAEIAMGWGTSTIPTERVKTFSRALIVDGSGLPTVLPVLADEQLDISYTLVINMPWVEQTTSLTINGVPTTVSSILRTAAYYDTAAGWFGNWVGGVGGAQAHANGQTLSTCTQFLPATSNAVGTSIPVGVGTAGWTETVEPYVLGSFKTVRHFTTVAGRIPTGKLALNDSVLAQNGPRVSHRFVPPINVLNTQRVRFTMGITLSRA